MSVESPSFGMVVESESGNEAAESIDSYVDEIVDNALSRVRERYEHAPEEFDNLPFHNVSHTEGVIRRTESILSAIQEADASLVSDRDILMGRSAAGSHDTAQRWEENTVADVGFFKVLRRRFVGENENSSAREGIADMDEINQREGKEIFSLGDKAVFQEAIDGTVPGWDPVNKTAMQPKLSEESSLIARAVALADLATAGMDGPEAFIPEGNALFREENLDILKAIRGSDIPADQKEYFKKRMVGWIKSQVGFARGRQARLEIELQAIPEVVRGAVATLFDKFDASITASEAFAQAVDGMSFEELAEKMGY